MLLRRLPTVLGTACGLLLAAVPQHALAYPAPATPVAQWPLTFLKSSQIWQLTKGAGVTVGLVDSGVSPLGDNKANLLPGADFSSGPTSIGIAHIDTDTDSHGTAMAVIIAGTGAGLGLSGLAPEAKILPARMQKSSGSDPDMITDAILYATSQHVKVINMSLGTAQTPRLAAAVKAAQDADIVIVAAAGNAGTSNVITPAAYPGVVAAAAVNSSGARWSYSNYGPQVTLAAPGVGIPVENAYGQPHSFDGTSSSSAYITASAALVRSLHPDWSAGQTIRALLATATKAGGASGLNRNNNYGYGIVNPLAALGIAAPVAKDNPLLPGAAPLAAGVAPVAAPPTTAPTTTQATPSTASSPTTHATATQTPASNPTTKPKGLLSTRRNKLLAVAGGGAVFGVFCLGLNSVLKHRSTRRRRSW